MRRLYVLPKATWDTLHEHCHPSVGSHYLELGDGMILCSTDFAGEAQEDAWHLHPEVGVLPNPVYEGTHTLKAHVDNPNKNLQQRHVDALKSIGLGETSTVLDVHHKASKLNPLVKLRLY